MDYSDTFSLNDFVYTPLTPEQRTPFNIDNLIVNQRLIIRRLISDVRVLSSIPHPQAVEQRDLRRTAIGLAHGRLCELLEIKRDLGL